MIAPAWHRRNPTTFLRSAASDVSLRIRLVAMLVVLVAAGLFGTWFIGSQVMENYLLGQLNTRITAMLGFAERQHVGSSEQLDQTHAGRGGFQLPGRTFVLFRTQANTDYYVSPSGSGRSRPALPPFNAAPVKQPMTVASQDNSDIRWRIIADRVNGGELIVGADQRDVDAAVAALRHTFLLVSAIVLMLIVVIGYALVRSSLRPLDQVKSTAEAIAAGELSRRVPVRPSRSEVGRLASALNTMLARIEDAFLAKGRSEEAARHSEDRMRQFVADASHELRTPLTSIRGYAELYRQGAVDSADITAVFSRIEQQAARMGVLVEDLLLLARLDRQRPLSRSQVDLGVIAVDAVHEAKGLDRDQPIRLHLNSTDQAVLVLGDEVRLRQVVNNLISNAITHTPAGTPIEVRVYATAHDGKHEAVLEVADEGPGLSQEHAARVFERFYRADEARGRHNGGTGLGLSIVAALVKAHDGRVELDTAAGQGAVFRVILPAYQAAEQRLED